MAIDEYFTEGVVVHAGGSLKTGKVFEYDGSTKRIVFSADI